MASICAARFDATRFAPRSLEKQWLMAANEHQPPNSRAGAARVAAKRPLIAEPLGQLQKFLHSRDFKVEAGPSQKLWQGCGKNPDSTARIDIVDRFRPLGCAERSDKITP